jgi:hypothetical protein
LRVAAGATTLILAGSFIGACANIEAPPGGPEDILPPTILTTRPDPDAIVPGYNGPVVFVFDERISERGIEEAVMVSPRTSPVEVRHGRDEVRISLRRGWEPGHIYQVTLQAAIYDLFGNILPTVERLVFSTGPAIPDTRGSGTVIDRVTGRRESNIRVEAIRLADSLVYAVATDTAGAFVLDRFPPGEYQVRAYQDVNRNRSLEVFESRDSAFVEVLEGDPFEVAFRIVAPDSTPPQASSATLRQSRIEIDFDDYLDPEQTIDDDRVSVVAPTGVAVPIEGVFVGTGARIFPPRAPGDSLPDRPFPAAQTLVVQLPDSVELEPDAEYVVTLEGILNVNGLEADVELTVTTPPGPNPIALVSRRGASRYIARRRAT